MFLVAGAIPPEVGNLTALTDLSLERNQLTGAVVVNNIDASVSFLSGAPGNMISKADVQVMRGVGRW